jgi:methylase of polypeptide subunit release factors
MPKKVHDIGGLSALDGAILRDLRAALTRSLFDEKSLYRAEAIAPRQLDAVRVPLVLAHLRRDDTPASLLLRLFAYDDAVERAKLDQALGSALVDRLFDAGLFERSGQGVGARFRIMPFYDVYFLSDDMTAAGDPVMGPGATTHVLGAAFRAKAGQRMLDMGCGAGTFALLAAKAGADATGVDLHPRAVAISEINARLNGLSARFLAGDLFAPVAGETFDLVVSQPPFVITPPDLETTTYLHGGAMGDELTMRLLGELPKHLSDRGSALVLFDSADRKAPLIERVRAAISDDDLQIFAFVGKGAGADQQASAYAAARHPSLDDDYRDAVFRYLAHLERCGIETASRVLLRVSRPGPNEAPFAASRPLETLNALDADALERAHEGLVAASRGDGELARRALALPAGSRFIEERPVGGEPSIKLQVRGLADRELSDAAAALIELVISEASLDAACAKFAELAGAPVEEMRPQVLVFVRESLAGGVLELR